MEVRFVFWVLFRELGVPLAPCPVSHPLAGLRKRAFSHLPSHSPVVWRSFIMTQSKAAHAPGVRLHWRLDTEGSLLSISHCSSSATLVSDMHWLSWVSQHQTDRGGRGWWPLGCTSLEELLPSRGLSPEPGLTLLLTQYNSCRAREFTPRLHRCCCAKNR